MLAGQLPVESATSRALATQTQAAAVPRGPSSKEAQKRFFGAAAVYTPKE